jgi:hypothetical protein
MRPPNERAGARFFLKFARAQILIFSNSERGTQMLSAFLFRDLDASERQIALDIEQERGMNGAIKGFFACNVLLPLSISSQSYQTLSFATFLALSL